jgi:hypothetical protein
MIGTIPFATDRKGRKETHKNIKQKGITVYSRPFWERLQTVRGILRP